MSIIGTIIIGFFVGLVARFIKPGDDKMGLLFTTMVGIVGAFVGKFIGQAVGVYRADEPAGFVGAVIGAVLVLTLLKVTNNRRITH
ncbi:MAG: GlsB/YeaQ/YmgE family stress response membrane protein [Bacteriovorax sp.]|nr:GlsB/YeaQ/YmgE family stress response membrane protein [Bacteriovorax sp.]